MSARHWSVRWLIALVITVVLWQPAWALITGGTGNKPLPDPGWPQGAATVFNTKSRVAYWTGSPFDSGQSHAECRGDSAAFQQVLNDFAKIETPKKRVVLHDGVGHSFMLNPNREQQLEEQSRIDWTFMVWDSASFNGRQPLRPEIRTASNSDEPVFAELDVYTGGSIRWSDIVVPTDVLVVDERLAAHGFTLKDGRVLEGQAIDLATRQPIPATVILERVERQKEGGYQYVKLTEVTADAGGHWVLTNAPPEQCRLILKADGYVPRIISHEAFDGQPGWSRRNSGLSRPASVTGRVIDQQGRPLPDVDVRITNLLVDNSVRYQLPDDSPLKTDGDGCFTFASLPQMGSASIRVGKEGYVRPGLGLKIKIPETDLVLEMQPASKLRISVEFKDSERGGYLVEVKPEGGEKVGPWGASSNLDATNQVAYENIPPGKYVIIGRPNPGNTSQETAPVTVDLQGGGTTEVTLQAK